MTSFVNDNIRKTIREQYRKLAILDDFGYCSSSSCCVNPLIANIKNGFIENDCCIDANKIPEGSYMGLGCGNPTILASLKIGETVLDLGSGGGFDCFVARQTVGESGRVIGVDMTPEMINKSRKNAENAGYKNVEFLLGEIEFLPVADDLIDVIISNCAINLSPEKEKVFSEAFRVLKPGGRLAASDVVAIASLPKEFKNDTSMNARCILGTSFIYEIENMLKKSGFIEIKVKPKTESKKFIQNWIPKSKLEDYIVSATIEAVKPSKEMKTISVA